MRSCVLCLFLAIGSLLAGCTERPHYATDLGNPDERLAQTIMFALGKSDMRPVVKYFVPERKRDLLDPAHVRVVRDGAYDNGDFLGLHEVPPPPSAEPLAKYFLAQFTRGVTGVTIVFDTHGKIVHYRIGLFE